MNSSVSLPPMAMSNKLGDELQQTTNMTASNNVEVAKEKISFFSLPAELRNKIMDLVLVPGDVYLWLPSSMAPGPSMDDPSTRGRSRIGAQLLATNRQAYNEGRAKYYSLNRFHLPSLSASDCHYILNRYQTKNLETVRHVVLGCYLTQFLNDDMVKRIEEKIVPLMEKLTEENGRIGYNRHRWTCGLMRPLLLVWYQQLQLIHSNFPNLESLIIREETQDLDPVEQPGGNARYRDPRIEQYIFEGSALQEELERLDNKETQTNATEFKLYHRIFVAARENAYRLERRINAFGWEKTKTWLMTGAEVHPKIE